MPVKRLCALVVVVGLSLAQAQADTSSSTIELPKRYHNCGTWTILHQPTAEKVHIFACFEETLTDTQITIGSKSGSLEIALRAGIQLHMEGSIPVAIRIDNGPLIERTAEWDMEGAKDAIIHDQQLANQLLHDLARGQRIAIQVGDERGHIRLDGSQRAIADFRQRAGLQPQQTLEIPTESRP